MKRELYRSIQAGLCLLLGCGIAEAQDYVISTYAGGVPPATPAPALKTPLGATQGVAVDSSGNVYFNALNCIFRMDVSGNLTRIAGTGRPGFSGDGGLAIQAQLWIPEAYANDDIDVNYPAGVAVDSLDNVYVADSGNARIRKISMGVITTVAGGGQCRQSCDGQPATNLALSYPSGLAIDRNGNLYLADGGWALYRIDSGGIVTAMADVGDVGASGLALDSSGNLYVAEIWHDCVVKITPAGEQSNAAGSCGQIASPAALGGPVGVASDAAGNLYIAAAGFIVGMSIDGAMTKVAGTGVAGYSGDGGPATLAQVSAWSLALDHANNLLFADQSSRIRLISSMQTIATIAGTGEYSYSGDGGPARTALLDFPASAILDPAGDLYFSDGGNRVRMISAQGVIRTVAGNGTAGDSGDGGPAISAQLEYVTGLAWDGGNLFLADSLAHRVRKISPDGTITTVAGTGIPGASGDGGPAVAAQLASPSGVAFDTAGNLYIVDDNRVRKVSSGVITTFAGNGNYGNPDEGGLALNSPFFGLSTITVDKTGSVYVGGVGFKVLKISPAGILTTVAGTGDAYIYSGDGGPAVKASIGEPVGLVPDTSGNLFMADRDNKRVYRISPDGIIRSVAGTGFNPLGPPWGASNDGGLATQAQLDPAGIAIDSKGNVYVGDGANNDIRLLQPLGPASVGGVHNAASNLAGPVAPGEIVVLGGSGLGPAQLTVAPPSDVLAAQLAGTIVTFDGVPAPIVYTSFTQVAAVVPYEVNGFSTQVTVSYLGVQSPPVTLAVTPSAPAIFTANSSGSGQAAARNSDNSLNGAANPAAAGSLITLFATGEGSSYPNLDGLPGRPLPSSISVTIGENAAPVFAAFEASPGLLELLVTIPGGTSVGNAVPVSVRVGNSASPPGVTVAVR